MEGKTWKKRNEQVKEIEKTMMIVFSFVLEDCPYLLFYDS